MSEQKKRLIDAEKKAGELFEEALRRGFLRPGKTENLVNKELFELAFELFGIEKYWHKRIVRAGKNTLYPYNENPPDLTIQENDIVFFDFGPIFEDWEADLGRTYVLGNDPIKLKLRDDIERCWWELHDWFHTQNSVRCCDLYELACAKAKENGWEFGGEIAGHLIGHFPHERLEKGSYGLYVHPENPLDMFALDAEGKAREWILEIHFVDREKHIGGFFEQLLTDK